MLMVGAWFGVLLKVALGVDSKTVTRVKFSIAQATGT